MDMLLKFGIGVDSSTFELPRYETPHYETGVFNMRFFKTGFAENLGLFCFPSRNLTTVNTLMLLLLLSCSGDLNG